MTEFVRDITELFEFELVLLELELWSEPRAYLASIVLLFGLILKSLKHLKTDIFE